MAESYEEVSASNITSSEEGGFILQSLFAPVSLVMRLNEGKSLADAFLRTFDRFEYVKDRRQRKAQAEVGSPSATAG